jgi:hypothetical protein
MLGAQKKGHPDRQAWVALNSCDVCLIAANNLHHDIVISDDDGDDGGPNSSQGDHVFDPPQSGSY